jgi:hypothetical protein
MGSIFDLGVCKGVQFLFRGNAEGYNFDFGVRELRTPEVEDSLSTERRCRFKSSTKETNFQLIHSFE